MVYEWIMVVLYLLYSKAVLAFRAVRTTIVRKEPLAEPLPMLLINSS